MAFPRTIADYVAALLSLLPRGRAWSRDADTVQHQVLSGYAPSLQRVDGGGFGLLLDAFPATTVGLLPEWEQTLGLPDPCAGPDPTIALRQAHVLARFQGFGGQSVPFFVAFAATLGFAITITEFTAPNAHVWQVNVAGAVTELFRLGVNRLGDRFETIRVDALVLQCEFARLKPAHTHLLWNFM